MSGEKIDFDHGEMLDFNNASNKQTRFFSSYNGQFIISQILTALDLKDKEGVSGIQLQKNWKIQFVSSSCTTEKENESEKEVEKKGTIEPLELYQETSIQIKLMRVD